MTGSARVGAVSAVICNYNGEGYLAECIDGLLALDRAIDEVLVVDNASTDGSLALLERDYPDVRVVQMGWNAGPCVARNAGMREARNRWVLAVDNDVILLPDVLDKLAAAADARPDAAAIQPRSVFHHETSRIHYDGGHLHYTGLISLRNFYTPIAGSEGEGTLDVDVAIALCLLVDKKPLLALGGYDEALFILFEDLDLSCRLRLAGYAILSVEDALVHHKSGTPGLSFREGKDYPATRIYYHSCNRWLYIVKCFRWRTLLVSLPGLLLYELVWLAFAISKRRFLAWVGGKMHLLKLLPQLVAKRRTVQQSRKVRDRDLLVGGPLTVTPALRESGLAGRAVDSIDRVLRAWWSGVRGLVG